MVNPEIWYTIPNEQVHPSTLHADEDEDAKYCKQGDVCDYNKLCIASSEYWAERVVMTIGKLVVSDQCTILISHRSIVAKFLCLSFKPEVAKRNLIFILVSIYLSCSQLILPNG